MPGFAAHALDPVAARVEVGELRALLAENHELSEAVLRKFFRERHNASVLIGHYNLGVQRVNNLAFDADRLCHLRPTPQRPGVQARLVRSRRSGWRLGGRSAAALRAQILGGQPRIFVEPSGARAPHIRTH